MTVAVPSNAMGMFEKSASEARHGGMFAWPDDGLSREPWYYDFHVAWVSRWNDAGRPGSAEDAARRYLSELLEGREE